MLSVSNDGLTIAAVGRVAGREHIWHVSKTGEARRMWSFPLTRYSGRLQVGWASSTDNVASDGEWVMLCESRALAACKPLIRGDLPAVSPAGKLIAILSSGKEVSVYDLESNRVVARLRTKMEWAHESPKWGLHSTELVLNEATRQGSELIVVSLDGKREKYRLNTRGRTTSQNGIVNGF